MKARLQKSLLVGWFMLLFSCPCIAQERQAQNTDVLREKVNQLESININTKPASQQVVFRRALLDVCNQFSAALEQEIGDLKKTQSAISDSDTDLQKAIANQLLMLSKDKSVILDKIQQLRNNAQVIASARSAVSTAAPVSADPQITAATFVHPDADSSPAGSTAGGVIEAGAPKVTSPVPTASSNLANIGARRSLDSLMPKPAPTVVALPSSRTTTTEIPITVEGDITSTLEFEQAASGKNKYAQTMSAKASDTGGAAKYFRTAINIPPQSGLTSTHKGSCSAGNYFRQCLIQVVRLDDNNNTLVASSYTDGEGHFKITFKADPAKRYELSTAADDYSSKISVPFPADPSNTPSNPVRLDIPLEDRPVSLLTRAIVGFEQAGAVSTKSDQNYFFDFFVSHSFPVPLKIDPNFGQRLRVWGDVRIASVPQQVNTDVATFAGTFAQNVAGLKVNELAHAIDFLAGIEYQIAGNSSLLPSFDRLTKQKFSLSLIVGGGSTILTTPPQDNIQFFKVFDSAPGLPPAAKGKEFIGFVSVDRDRFFRQYYAGLRFQTFFFNQYDRPLQRFPGVLDVTFGQNEFVTGGTLHGGVLRIDGFFPLPYDKAKYINLFATGLFRPGRAKISDPLILQPATTPPTFPSDKVVIVSTPQFNRDYYRVGVGIDFISLVKTIRENGQKNAKIPK